MYILKFTACLKVTMHKKVGKKAMQNQFKIIIWVLTVFWPLLGGQNCPVKTRFKPVLIGWLKPGWFKPFNLDVDTVINFPKITT